MISGKFRLTALSTSFEAPSTWTRISSGGGSQTVILPKDLSRASILTQAGMITEMGVEEGIGSEV
jgi:hypothetical protein